MHEKICTVIDKRAYVWYNNIFRHLRWGLGSETGISPPNYLTRRNGF